MATVVGEAAGAEGAVGAVGAEIIAADAPRRTDRAHIRVVGAHLEEPRGHKRVQPCRRLARRVQARHLLQADHGCVVVVTGRPAASLWIRNHRLRADVLKVQALDVCIRTGEKIEERKPYLLLCVRCPATAMEFGSDFVLSGVFLGSRSRSCRYTLSCLNDK